jgi:hypothetical protein
VAYECEEDTEVARDRDVVVTTRCEEVCVVGGEGRTVAVVNLDDGEDCAPEAVLSPTAVGDVDRVVAIVDRDDCGAWASDKTSVDAVFESSSPTEAENDASLVSWPAMASPVFPSEGSASVALGGECVPAGLVRFFHHDVGLGRPFVSTGVVGD